MQRLKVLLEYVSLFKKSHILKIENVLLEVTIGILSLKASMLFLSTKAKSVTVVLIRQGKSVSVIFLSVKTAEHR